MRAVFLTGLALVLWAGAAAAGGTIAVHDAYARFLPGARSGAAFMVIENTGEDADRLLAVQAEIARKVELHTHEAGTDGMMAMRHLSEGIEISAHGDHALARGGDHVMFMGLQSLPESGTTVPVTLVFEKAGAITVDVPVDNAR